MVRTYAVAIVLSTLIGSIDPGSRASAQTSPPSSSEVVPSTATPLPTPGPDKFTEASAIKFITEQGAGEFRASKLVGLSVFGTDNQRVGDITEVLLDDAGAVQAVVIGVGGFLGIGEKSVAVPFGSLAWVNTRPPTTLAASTGVIGTAVTAVTGGVGAVKSATAEVTLPAKSPAEIAAYNGFPDHAVLRISKADLQNAPTFKYYAETHPQSSPNAAAGTAKK